MRKTAVGGCAFAVGALRAPGGHKIADALETPIARMGAAYQFRDDLLGMFGDPSMTGKSDRDDLRDGKPTLLVCTALELLEKGDRSRLLDLYTSGRDDDATVQEVRALLRKSGAMKKVEDTIATVARDTEQAIAAAPLPPAGRQALTGITASFLWRQK